ncbi:hypothetical protein BT96DRAFT_950996 [Gymnopus androsaceus JB14]|uniref:Uncharacterized protein n=1 Tax=Gymnopus androsaceus JB14 TaxID=1447944 RepID=A0A6A4GE71_9AGAR|nr:hypothetical protein BT96DRAFT_950996 [Gymnopus androsaceus JB14]
MTSSDSTYPGPWDTRASFSPSHFEGPDNTHQAYNHFRADQIYPPVEQVEDSTGSGSAADFSQFTSDAHSYSSSIACEPTFSFHHSPQSVVFNESTTFQPHHFEGLEQTDVKSTPRIDVLVENIGYQHESISSSPSWNASPSSASTDATSRTIHPSIQIQTGTTTLDLPKVRRCPISGLLH